MSDPRRLLEDPNVSTGAKHLLGSLDAPSPLSTAARLDIGARVTKSVALPVAATKLVSLKAAAILSAAVFAGGGAALYTSSRPETASLAKPVATAVKPVLEARTQPALLPAPVAEAEVLREPEPAAKPSTSEQKLVRRDTLALEEALLEQARRAAGSPAQALSLLREHERRFPNGELTAERLYLTAQVQARAGNLPAARRSATILAARFPKSTYVPRVEALLAQSAP